MSIYAIIAAVAIIAVTIIGAHWKGKVEGRSEGEAKISILEQRSHDKDAQIDAQNSAIDKMHTESTQKQKAASMALIAAQELSKKNMDNVLRIMALQPTGNECEDAEKLIAKEMNDVKELK